MNEKRISSLSHENVKHWVRLQKDKSYRHASKRILVEGKNLVRDLSKRHKPIEVIITEPHLKAFSQHNPTIISQHIAEKISDVLTPEGCFAEFELPTTSFPTSISTGIIFDGLQDPGNVGTLFRTALAFGIHTVFLIEPSCDPWNPKVIRAARGSQFDQTIVSCSWKDLPTNIPLFVADLNGEDIKNLHIPKKWLLVLGNEAQGPKLPPSSPHHKITIPMKGPTESLNVAQAGAVLLYTFSSKYGS